MAFAKSIIRSLVDGGTQLSDEKLLIDRLEEFCDRTSTNKQLALYGGLGQIGLGIALATINPICLIAIAPGAYCLSKLKSNKLTNTDERELRFLSKHRNIFGVFKRLKLRGGDDEEILQSFEALISRYDYARDQIILIPGEHEIPAGNAIAGFETVAAQIQSHEGEPPSTAAQPKRSFLAEHLSNTTQQPQVGNNTRFNALPAQSQPVVEFEATTAQGQDSHVSRSEDDAIAILDGLVASRRSTLLVGGTGAGKTVTQAYLLVNMLRRCPDTDIYVISQKADSFGGLAEVGKVTLFNQFAPDNTLAVIDRVWNEYDRRRKLPESQRSGLSPVRLLLCDWLSINASLEASAKDPVIKESRYLSKLIDVIYNGRELNVCLWIDLQSFNLAAIGMKADANSRRNFNLVGLGNYYVDEDGGINESYGVLANMIQNRYFVDNDSDREKLMREFNRLKPISKQGQRPILFTTLEPARVVLVADVRSYKTIRIVAPHPKARPEPPISPTPPTTKADTSPRIDDVKQNLDRAFNLPSANHETEEEVTESNTTLDALTAAFPKGGKSFFDAALKTIEYLEKRRGETTKTRDLQAGIASLKSQPAQRVRDFLSALGEKGFIQVLSSEDGKESYAALDLTNDDDFNW